MYIKEIDIKNYRGIKSLHMKFNEGINLVIGNNSAGKTSLLNALAVLLCEPLLLLRGIHPIPSIEASDAHVTTTLMGDAVVQPVPQYPVLIQGILDWQGKEYTCQRMKENEVAQPASNNYELVNAFQSTVGDAEISLPVLSFQRAGRSQINKQERITLSNESPQRVHGYKGAFSPELNIEEILRWCTQMEFAEFQRKQGIREYAEFQKIISNFIALIDEKVRKPRLYYSADIGSVVYFDGTDEKPLYQLSAGYQAVLCMIIELAYRAVILNPASADIASTVSGVVLIDEIEMHLHPAWQWKILSALKGTFPHIQFIIATHSPIILSSAKGANLFLMKSPDEVVMIDSVYGYDINEVLSLPQGSESRPEAVSKYYEEAETIFDNGTASELDNLLERAGREFDNNPSVLKDLRNFIEVNRWVEEA